MSIAKDRMYRRLEKFLLTVESLLVAVFCGVCASFFWSKGVGASIALWAFLLIYARKRVLIYRERRHG